MNQKWKTNSIVKIADGGERLKLYSDGVTTPSGRESTYYHVETLDGVLIIPLRIKNEEEVSFIFTEQYRYPIGRRQFEFPGGAKAPGEANEDAARRELREETGYEAKSIKFLYSMNPIPSLSSFKMSVYVAYIEDEPGETHHEDDEEDAGLSTKEFSADRVLQMIRENEITDGKTLAALATVLLQSPKALEYANSLA